MRMKRAAALLLGAFFSFACCGAAGAAELQPVPDDLFYGIDVSVDQGDIDFYEVADAGIKVVYIRAGIGDEITDANFYANARGAKAAGLAFGCYYFVTAFTTDQAVAQADYFAELLSQVDYTCRPAMDFEVFSGRSTAEVNAIGTAFVEELESKTGVTPLIYTDAYAADVVWGDSFGAYPLWVAAWDAELPDVSSGIWAGWAGFQYLDDGSINGIDTAVDLDRFTTDVLLHRSDTTSSGSGSGSSGSGSGSGEQRYFLYTVRPGDTVWGISQRYGTTVSAIASLNSLTDPSLIYPGEVLKIPN